MFKIGSGYMSDYRPLGEWTLRDLKKEKSALLRDSQKGFHDQEAIDAVIAEIENRAIA